MERQSEKALLRGAPRELAPLAADVARLGRELAARAARAEELAARAAVRALTGGEAAEAARLEADGARLARELRALRREFDAPSPGREVEHPDAPSGDPAVRASLTGPGLLAVQLLAAGYSPDQIASVRGVAPEDVRGDLQEALTALGAPTVGEAIAAAKRRGLID